MPPQLCDGRPVNGARKLTPRRRRAKGVTLRASERARIVTCSSRDHTPFDSTPAFRRTRPIWRPASGTCSPLIRAATVCPVPEFRPQRSRIAIAAATVDAELAATCTSAGASRLPVRCRSPVSRAPTRAVMATEAATAAVLRTGPAAA